MVNARDYFFYPTCICDNEPQEEDAPMTDGVRLDVDIYDPEGKSIGLELQFVNYFDSRKEGWKLQNVVMTGRFTSMGELVNCIDMALLRALEWKLADRFNQLMSAEKEAWAMTNSWRSLDGTPYDEKDFTRPLHWIG